jgi:hypothetical protein
MDSDTTVREGLLGDHGIDYVHWRLSTGGPLAQVLRHIDLNAGRAVTLFAEPACSPADEAAGRR